MASPVMTGTEPAGCPFCQVISATRDPGVCLMFSVAFVAFPALHQRPGHRVHMLMVAREHLPNLDDMTDEMGPVLLRDLKTVAAAVKQVCCADGVAVRLNAGAPGQSVAHTHFHIIPRYVGDNFDIERSVEVPLSDRLAASRAFSLNPAVRDFWNLTPAIWCLD